MRSLRFIALLALPGQIAFGQQASSAARGSTLSLDDAIATAHRNNPAFLQIENLLRNSESTVRQAYAALLPSSSAQFSTRYQQGGTQFVQGVALGGSSADSRQSSYSVGLNYFINGSVAFAPRSARASRDASEADIANQAEALRTQVTQQYIAALQSRAQAALQDTLVQTATGQLELANAKMKVGAGTILDVRTAEVAVGQAQVAALTAHNNAQVDKLRLFQLMGVAPDTAAELTTKFAVADPRFSLDSLLDLARKVNPDVAAKKSRQFADEMNVKAAKTQYIPSLSLSTGVGGNSFEYVDPNLLVSQSAASAAAQARSCLSQDSIRTRIGLSGLTCGSGQLSADQIAAIRASNNQFPFKFNRNPIGVSATLSLPIFNNYQREAQIEAAKVARDNAAYDVRSRNLQLTTEVTQAYLTLVTDAKTVQLQEQNAAKATEELAFAEESYKVGAKTFLDVTTARGTYEQALSARVNAIYEYHKAFAALEGAVGRPLR
ncbi:MAG TPA: TolC family protein [Gemmatimonadaceae bacterium]|jgi:outer membrane protein|nr:TolC family protein [Gemmatimonadaceae bacterium]